MSGTGRDVNVKVRISPEDAANLAVVAKQTERNLSQVIRLAIREYLEREAQNGTA